MANYINPFTDIGFKRIFGQEFSKPLLIDFLNNLLIGEKRIVDFEKGVDECENDFDRWPRLYLRISHLFSPVRQIFFSNLGNKLL